MKIGVELPTVLPVLPIDNPKAVRKNHARQAMMELVRLIQDLVRVVPMAFLRGAIVGPIFLISTFAFSTALLTVGGASVYTTVGTIALIGGAASALLTIVPYISDHIKQAWVHVKWVRHPQEMAVEENRQQKRHHRKIVLVCVVAGTCLVAMISLLFSRDLLALYDRLTGIETYTTSGLK